MNNLINGLRCLFLVAISAACGLYVYKTAQTLDTAPEEPPPRRPMTVEVVRSTNSRLDDSLQLIGSIEPAAQVQMRSRVSGYIRNVSPQIGQKVTKLEELVSLENSQDQELLVQAESALKIAEAQLNSKVSERNLATLEWERSRKVAEESVFTSQQIEQLKTRLDITEADVELAEAQVEAARSAVERARLVLAELNITAPINGFVAERFVEPGDLAKPDDPLLTIVDLSRVRIRVHVPERDYERIHLDQTVSVEVDAIPDEVFMGKILLVSPVLAEQTRTAVVEIDLPNTTYRLKPGMHARAFVKFPRDQDVVTVPASSVVNRNGNAVVFVFDEQAGVVREKIVEPGLVLSDLVEIPHGLLPHTPIVRLGSRLLEDGQEVAALWAVDE